jgi:hypothetical protein
MNRNGALALHLVPSAILIAAIGLWPYGYFTLLRIVVCAAAIWLAVLDYQRVERVVPWVVVLGVCAALFNPVAPIFLTREIWTFLDPAMAVVLGLHLWSTWKEWAPA